MVVPFGTTTSRPSIVRRTVVTGGALLIGKAPFRPSRGPAGRDRCGRDVAGPGPNVLDVLVAEVPERRTKSRRHALAERAQTDARHLLGDVVHQLQVFHAAVPLKDAVQDLTQPDRPLPAWRTLAA